MTGEAAMQAHVVLAHPEPLSYNAHLARLARRTLEVKGWQVTVSDLHAMGFDPLEGPRHYASRNAPDRSAPQPVRVSVHAVIGSCGRPRGAGPMARMRSG